MGLFDSARAQTHRVDRDAAVAEIGLSPTESIQSGWFERAVDQLGTLGRATTSRRFSGTTTGGCS